MALEIRKLSLGTVYKLTTLGFLCSLVPFCLLMGVFAAFGAETLTWNEQPVKGLTGLIASPFIGLFMALVFSALLGTALAFGLWVYSWFGTLTIRYREP